MQYDLVFKNGVVVTEGGRLEQDVAVSNGVIAALGARGSFMGHEEIDASGLLLLPGGVDTHVHFEQPGMSDWEDWAHASRAAARGGVTTVTDMPVDNLPPTVDAITFASKKKFASASSCVDFLLWGGLTASSLSDLEDMLRLGAPGFKAFLALCGGPYFPPAADGTLFEGMCHAAHAGRVVTVHCENQAIIDYHTNRLYKEKERLQPADYIETRPLLAELEAVNRVLFLAEQAGARVNIAHASSARVAELARRARENKQQVTVETCAHYLRFCNEELVERGAILKCSPPLRDQSERDGLWHALKEGGIDFVASDHSPAPAELRAWGADDFDKVQGGIAGVQFTLNVLYSDGVLKQGLTLERLVSVFSSNAARMLGVYGQKGAIEEGFDADLVLFDPTVRWTVCENDYLAKLPLSPYIGETFDGDTAATFVRGTRVYDRRQAIRAEGHGRMLRVAR